MRIIRVTSESLDSLCLYSPYLEEQADTVMGTGGWKRERLPTCPLPIVGQAQLLSPSTGTGTEAFRQTFHHLEAMTSETPKRLWGQP